jgi:hypothetical protein
VRVSFVGTPVRISSIDFFIPSVSTRSRHGLSRVRATVRCIDKRPDALLAPKYLVRGVLSLSASSSSPESHPAVLRTNEASADAIPCFVFINTVHLQDEQVHHQTSPSETIESCKEMQSCVPFATYLASHR